MTVAPRKLAPEIEDFERTKLVRSAPAKLTPSSRHSMSFAPARLAPPKFASTRFKLRSSKPERLAPIRFALGPKRYPPKRDHSVGSEAGTPIRFPVFRLETLARANLAPVRLAPVRLAPVRSAPVRSAPVRSAPVRSAPVRSASGPTKYPFFSNHPVGRISGSPVIPPEETPFRLAD